MVNKRDTARGLARSRSAALPLDHLDAGVHSTGADVGGAGGTDGASKLLRPLSARSVLASTLLGTHPPELPVAALVRTAAAFGIAAGSARVALSRMVTRGELECCDGRYRLTGALANRQRSLDEGLSPRLEPWDGSWIVVVLDDRGRSADARRGHRRILQQARLGELREGVWLRPANLAELDGELAAIADAVAERFRARPDGESAELARSLFDLEGWAARARALIRAIGPTATATDGARGTGATGRVGGRSISTRSISTPPSLSELFSLDAAVVRHLRGDPVLPPEITPTGWPAPELRLRFDDFDANFRRRWRAWVRSP